MSPGIEIFIGIVNRLEIAFVAELEIEFVTDLLNGIHFAMAFSRT